jgi:hypothetical protein
MNKLTPAQQAEKTRKAANTRANRKAERETIQKLPAGKWRMKNVTNNPQDPPPDSQERLNLVLSIAKAQAAARGLAEEREAAMTPEERDAAQAAADALARNEDIQLHEEAKHQRKLRDQNAALDANLDGPMAARGGELATRGVEARKELSRNRITVGGGEASYDDSAGGALRTGRYRTGEPKGRPATLAKVGDALDADRTKRGREKWLKEHSTRPAGFPDKQWEACVLVYGHVGDDAEAGRRMKPAISKQAVAKLRKKAAARGLLDPRPW